MGKKKKAAVLITGGMLIAILGIFIIVSVMGGRREIDQKVLFIYRYQTGGHGNRYYVNKGYLIDGEGRQVEYDYTKPLGIKEDTLNDKEMLKMLEETELKEGEKIFSEREVVKLYDWLYKIDAGKERDLGYERYGTGIIVDGVHVLGTYELLGIRYKADGTAEIIRIFALGGGYNWKKEESGSVENQDPYALKIRKVILEKNPMVYWLKL